MSGQKRLRCAIYTRKSSEEGLDQAFNSLDAQREACEAYVLSQAGEGWECIKTPYDDGGYSGGSMERPAVKRLMADVATGLIDVIVVYKVDRLTRSLADFAKIVEILDATGASFVSVTQAFNTTTSMGRLTLNVLLSFAQFEREVTGERIRDKFLASRKKGMWMGGNPPLGYDIKERKLVVNEEEKERVRHLFKRYLELRSVPALTEELAANGITTKKWVSTRGLEQGGGRFTRGALYHLLRNRVYIGDASHKGQNYPGEHEAIVDADIWNDVQTLLTENATHHEKISKNSRASNPLQGLLYDDRGNLMTPHYTSKSKGRYRYYVSQALLQHDHKKVGSLGRVAAQAVEAAVERILIAILQASHRSELEKTEVNGRRALIERTIERIDMGATQVVLRFLPGSGDLLNKTACRSFGGVVENKDAQPIVTVPLKLVSGGGAQSVLIDGLLADKSKLPNGALLKALARAWRWRQMLEAGAVKDLSSLAWREDLDHSYIKKVLRLAFLPPATIEAVLQGRQPRDISLAGLMSADVPLQWARRAG